MGINVCVHIKFLFTLAESSANAMLRQLVMHDLPTPEERKREIDT